MEKYKAFYSGVKKESSIKTLIEDEGLVVEFKQEDMTSKDDYYPKGYAFRQEPAAGEKLPEGSFFSCMQFMGDYNEDRLDYF